MKNNLKIIFILLLAPLPFVLNAQKIKPGFTNVTQKAGITFKYNFGDHSFENILESSGSGVTIFDYNNDGQMDIYLMNGTYLEGISKDDGKVFKDTPNELYKNNGDGTFTEVAIKAGVDDRHWSMAAGAIDIDNDGFQDLYLLNYGPNVFYHNNGNGTFSDITEKTGLRGPEKLNGFTKLSIGVSFWDYNNDNLLDAMVGNFLAFDPEYVSPQTPELMPHPSEYRGQASFLYQQQPSGKFTDISQKANLFFPDSKCMGITIYDFDEDGDMDIYQANDHQLNFLFKNENGIYKDVAIEAGVASNSLGIGTGSMHATLGDIDGDGLIDILVGDLSFGALYKNLGNGFYKDITETSGVAGTLSGKGSWGTAFLDYDNDGDLDLVSANGNGEELILQYPVFMENDGKGHFKDVGKELCPYFATKRSGRGLAVLDYNNDGNMDIIISHLDLMADPALLMNNGGNNNHWLGLILNGKNGPGSTISAKVTVTAGGVKRVFINQWATSYLSNNEQRIHVGLGQQKSVEQIEVQWTNGKKEIFRNIPVDKYLVLKEGTGIVSK